MRIEIIICPEHIEEKLASKHHVSTRETHQVLFNQPRIRFAEKGYIEGESARDMTSKERKAYGRK